MLFLEMLILVVTRTDLQEIIFLKAVEEIGKFVKKNIIRKLKKESIYLK